MDELLAGLKALAEVTRIRILFALSQSEMNVSELVAVLGQSQPRVSRHLKLMTEAGLISRYKEGNWVLFRLREDGINGTLSRSLVDLLPANEALLSGDRSRIDDIRAKRIELASAYFSANAANWEQLRALHVDEADVERTMLKLVGAEPISDFVDLGTGTGRMLELFAPHAKRMTGLDLSREMLAIARANIERHGLKNAQIRQADIYALPLADASADFVSLHQVLHYLDEPQRAIMEARRILKPHGRILITDFAPHELEHLREQHAHRRLGISQGHMGAWLERAGLATRQHVSLPPKNHDAAGGLTVSLWLADKAAA